MTMTMPPSYRRQRADPKKRLRMKKTWILIFVLVAGTGLLISGCAGWLGPPTEIQYDSDTTQILMDRLQHHNDGLGAVKGLGRVTVTTSNDKRVYERAVWVGADPGRLRFAFLAPSGLPVFSMSCDEIWLTALNHSDGAYYRRQIGDNSLSRFLPVSIKCVDLFALLVGRPPRLVYDTVLIADDGTAGQDDSEIELKRRFRGTVGRLWVDRERGELRSVELIDINHNRLYEARVQEMQTIAGYRLPTNITLNGPEGALTLEAKRVWPESTVTEDMFRIEPPSSN